MSCHSATRNSKEETDELDTAVASTSLVSFRSAVAGFCFNPESPMLRRSSGESRQVEKLGLCKETEFGQTSVENKSTQSSKRKVDEAKTASVVKKKKKPKRSYAEPQRYAHLNGLPDILGDELDGKLYILPSVTVLILFKYCFVGSSQYGVENNQFRD